MLLFFLIFFYLKNCTFILYFPTFLEYWPELLKWPIDATLQLNDQTLVFIGKQIFFNKH